MDFDCSFYVTLNMNFTTHHYIDGSEVHLENNDAINIVGVGDIGIIMPDIVVRTLIGERHVSKLKKNLISLSALNWAGRQCTLEGEVLMVV